MKMTNGGFIPGIVGSNHTFAVSVNLVFCSAIAEIRVFLASLIAAPTCLFFRFNLFNSFD